MITCTEKSMSPPFRKRQKIIYDTNGDQINGKLLHQEEENTHYLSLKQ
jgi:hypothetical protein